MTIHILEAIHASEPTCRGRVTTERADGPSSGPAENQRQLAVGDRLHPNGRIVKALHWEEPALDKRVSKLADGQMPSTTSVRRRDQSSSKAPAMTVPCRLPMRTSLPSSRLCCMAVTPPVKSSDRGSTKSCKPILAEAAGMRAAQFRGPSTLICQAANISIVTKIENGPVSGGCPLAGGSSSR
jgi:hypothetical protein